MQSSAVRYVGYQTAAVIIGKININNWLIVSFTYSLDYLHCSALYPATSLDAVDFFSFRIRILLLPIFVCMLGYTISLSSLVSLSLSLSCSVLVAWAISFMVSQIVICKLCFVAKESNAMSTLVINNRLVL